MARVLALPFKVTAAGEAATVLQGGDDYYKQQLAALLLTYRGERHIYVDLGMPDMAFDRFLYSTFNDQVATYLPAISILAVESVWEDDRSESLLINFDTEQERI